MRPLSPGERARMAATQESAMLDTCRLISRTESSATDDYGKPIMTETVVVSPCGLNLKASQEFDNAQARVYDAQLRLPLDTILSNIDVIEITHRFGEPVDVLRYEVIGDTRRGPSGLLVDLRSLAND